MSEKHYYFNGILMFLGFFALIGLCLGICVVPFEGWEAIIIGPLGCIEMFLVLIPVVFGIGWLIKKLNS